MGIESVVTLANLGAEFDIGQIEAGKIHLKLDDTLEQLANGSIAVVAAPAHDYLCQIWAEENGALNTGEREWSFGNGQMQGMNPSGNWGVVLPWPGSIRAMSMGVRVGGGQQTQVAVQLNGVDQDVITMIANATKVWRTNLTVPFQAGDVLNFRTVAAGGANDGVVSVVVRYAV